MGSEFNELKEFNGGQTPLIYRFIKLVKSIRTDPLIYENDFKLLKIMAAANV
jgi:hypothetical protein